MNSSILYLTTQKGIRDMVKTVRKAKNLKGISIVGIDFYKPGINGGYTRKYKRIQHLYKDEKSVFIFIRVNNRSVVQKFDKDEIVPVKVA